MIGGGWFRNWTRKTFFIFLFAALSLSWHNIISSDAQTKYHTERKLFVDFNRGKNENILMGKYDDRKIDKHILNYSCRSCSQKFIHSGLISFVIQRYMGSRWVAIKFRYFPFKKLNSCHPYCVNPEVMLWFLNANDMTFVLS
jgi:hypothetical protein